MSAKKEPDKYTRRAVYIGRRFWYTKGGKGRVVYVFQFLPSRKELGFGRIRRVHIGNTYKCGTDTMPRHPERDFERPREDNPEWDARDALVEAENVKRLAQAKAEAKVAALSKPALKIAIEALRPLVRGLDYLQCKNLVVYMIEKARNKK